MTHAHSWLGLIISGLLFTIFFCGTLSIYREEISQWAVQPHYDLAEGITKPVSDIMAIAIEGEKFDAHEHLSLVLPTKIKPYYTAYVDIEHEPGEKDYVSFIIDPVTGEKLNHVEQFFLANFIYKLHYNLNFSLGSYLLGFVTLFFFFALISGILIHAKKMVSNFFKFRTTQTKRSKLLDMHNVIGVMSLPFTLMYAISGLIFNLVIIYQIAFALVLYKGDRQALLDDAGYVAIEPKWQDEKWQQPDIDSVFNEIANRENYQPSFVRMYNYGDESAVLHVGGTMAGQLGGRFDLATQLSSLEETALNDPINTNMVRKGLQVVANLHFGNYAGFDLRLLYFVLGISVCVLIVAGNLLWVDKKIKQRSGSERAVNIARRYTLISTAGVVFAVAICFLLERILPITMLERDQWLINSFIGALVIATIISSLSQQTRSSLAYLLNMSACAGIAVCVYDVMFFSDKIISLVRTGYTYTAWVNFTIMVLAMACFYVANYLLKRGNNRVFTEKIAVN